MGVTSVDAYIRLTYIFHKRPIVQISCGTPPLEHADCFIIKRGCLINHPRDRKRARPDEFMVVPGVVYQDLGSDIQIWGLIRLLVVPPCSNTAQVSLAWGVRQPRVE